MLEKHKKDQARIANRKQESITKQKSDFLAHIFYPKIFEKEDLQTHFKHLGPIRIQTYLAQQIQEVRVSKFHLYYQKQHHLIIHVNFYQNGSTLKFQIFATFNCQGFNDKVKQKHISDDFQKFRLAAIMVQETRIKEKRLHEFTSSEGKKISLYNLCNGAKSIQGVGIITTESANVTFNPVSERIYNKKNQ